MHSLNSRCSGQALRMALALAVGTQLFAKKETAETDSLESGMLHFHTCYHRGNIALSDCS